MKGSLIIIAFFALGIAVGLIPNFSSLIPNFSLTLNNSSSFLISHSSFLIPNSSFLILCTLMFFVGVSIGSDTNTLKSFRSVNPRLMMLPVITIVGSLAGTMAASALLPHRHLFDCLAIGSGFGYYSLSSIFITEYKGAELGTIALLANIMREIITLLCAPLLIKFFGKLAPISMGGATTMDTTLPIITRTSGQDYVIVSIFHGFCVDFSVPFLVTFFCSL